MLLWEKQRSATEPVDCMRGYIQLDRKFVEFDERLQAGESDDFLFGLNLSSKIGKSWSDILKNRCTVILAEARSGKTTELRAQTERLRSEGQSAFFCRLEILADESFEDALEIGTSQDFQSWIASDTHGYFFLDSVDEARLASPSAFEKAVIHFAKVVKPHMHRSTVVISTRPNAWQAQSDPDMLKKLLSVPKKEKIVGHDINDFDFRNESHSPVRGSSRVETTGTADSPPVVMQMTPLNQSQVRIVAKAKGITDIDAFMEAINRADADVFATRPADLPSLIEAWKKDEPFGSYSDVVFRDIKLKLSDENSTHSDKSPISADRALAGAKVLAAAVTLTKRTSILLPNEPVDETLRGQCLDPKEVLLDWRPAEIRELLGLGLFDEALYGSVRFHHRAVREYLAARWFEELLLQQTNRRGIECLCFTSPYGVLPEVVVPALKPIVGWLAAWDQRIRDRALHIDPKVLLEYGDASALDIETRETLLRDFASRYENRQNTPLSLDVREVRRLADRRLTGVIRELLETHRNHVDVMRLLLRIIRAGGIPDCGQLTYSLAIDAEVDVYTRSIAVRAVGSAGTLDEQNRLAKEILAQASSLNHEIVNAAIDSLWPNALTDQGVLTLLEKTVVPGQFGAPDLEYVILQIPDRISDRDQSRAFLAAVLNLVSRPPLHNDEFCRISIRYDWLLNLLWALVGRLDLLHEAPETVPEFLAASALCSRSRHYTGLYRHHMDREIGQLLHSNAKIRHALFWHEYEQARKVEDETISFWTILHHYEFPQMNLIEKEDSIYYLEDLRERPNPKEKQAAMSVLFDVCNARKDANLLERIRDTVNADSNLKAEFDRLLTPSVPSKEHLEIQRRHSERESQRRQQEIEDAQARQNWIEKLKADPSMVGDLSLAHEGQVTKNTYWLLREIQEKMHTGNPLTASHWELLIPDFGEAVAQQFRDFCRAFWRRYTPPVRPENAKGSQTIPYALIVGLRGLAIEANGAETWAERLTDNEAEIATRYALRELNGFPDWFPSLLQAKPEPVRRMLREEIEWECSAFPPDGLLLYVLEKLRSTKMQIGKELRNDITDILAIKTDIPVNPLKSALALILKSEAPLPKAFQDTVARHAEVVTSEQQKALWLSALFCLDAERALDIMAAWVNSGTSQDSEQRVSLIISHLWGQLWIVDSAGFDSEHHDYMQPDVLVRSLEIVHSHIRPENDIQHDGVYTPGPRDNAQDAREHLLQLLCEIPGKPTCDALMRISGSPPLASFKDRLLNLAERRAEADADFKAWSPEQVAEFGRDAERSPETQRELFEIALSRLDAIKFDLEEGDDSEASLWRKVNDELELRRVIANRLKLISHNMYTTGSEEELADRSRTDIRLHHPKVDARIPIEIKIAGRWSANELRERMENQLGGQYLHEAHYGIFLLVNRGEEGDRRYWQHSKRLNFSALTQWLKDESRALLNEHVQDIEVIGIDLTKRTGEAAPKPVRSEKRR